MSIPSLSSLFDILSNIPNARTDSKYSPDTFATSPNSIPNLRIISPPLSPLYANVFTKSNAPLTPVTPTAFEKRCVNSAASPRVKLFTRTLSANAVRLAPDSESPAARPLCLNSCAKLNLSVPCCNR